MDQDRTPQHQAGCHGLFSSPIQQYGTFSHAMSAGGAPGRASHCCTAGGTLPCVNLNATCLPLKWRRQHWHTVAYWHHSRAC